MCERVLVRTFPPPPVRREEIARYAGGGCPPELLEQCLALCLPQLAYRACWRKFPLSIEGERLDLGFAKTASRALAEHLAGCEAVVVFAATVGLGVDRLILRHQSLSPAKALVFQAIGAERVEALCGAVEREIARSQKGYYPRPRFSPGYAGLPLQLQPRLLSALDGGRSIGVFLNQSLLMTPSKSVTAIIGLSRTEGPSCPGGCAACENTRCAFRKPPPEM